GGTSKSYTVLETLQKLKADYVLHNSRMTGRGLVDSLESLPASIHVIEDCESIFDDKRAWGVLRSALWSQSKKRPMERDITWTGPSTCASTSTASWTTSSARPGRVRPSGRTSSKPASAAAPSCANGGRTG